MKEEKEDEEAHTRARARVCLVENIIYSSIKITVATSVASLYASMLIGRNLKQV